MCQAQQILDRRVEADRVDWPAFLQGRHPRMVPIQDVPIARHDDGARAVVALNLLRGELGLRRLQRLGWDHVHLVLNASGVQELDEGATVRNLRHLLARDAKAARLRAELCPVAVDRGSSHCLRAWRNLFNRRLSRLALLRRPGIRYRFVRPHHEAAVDSRKAVGCLTTSPLQSRQRVGHGSEWLPVMPRDVARHDLFALPLLHSGAVSNSGPCNLFNRRLTFDTFCRRVDRIVKQIGGRDGVGRQSIGHCLRGLRLFCCSRRGLLRWLLRWLRGLSRIIQQRQRLGRRLNEALLGHLLHNQLRARWQLRKRDAFGRRLDQRHQLRLHAQSRREVVNAGNVLAAQLCGAKRLRLLPKGLRNLRLGCGCKRIRPAQCLAPFVDGNRPAAHDGGLAKRYLEGFACGVQVVLNGRIWVQRCGPSLVGQELDCSRQLLTRNLAHEHVAEELGHLAGWHVLRQALQDADLLREAELLPKRFGRSHDAGTCSSFSAAEAGIAASVVLIGRRRSEQGSHRRAASQAHRD